MSENRNQLICVTAKDEPNGNGMGMQWLRLEKVGGVEVANTLTTHNPELSMQHCNMVIDVNKTNKENSPWIWEINGIKYLIRIRKLTPKECWRLMDFTDEDFSKAEQVNSNTQLYKQAGNSIVKNVLCEVFKQLVG